MFRDERLKPYYVLRPSQVQPFLTFARDAGFNPVNCPLKDGRVDIEYLGAFPGTLEELVKAFLTGSPPPAPDEDKFADQLGCGIVEVFDWDADSLHSVFSLEYTPKPLTRGELSVILMCLPAKILEGLGRRLVPEVMSKISDHRIASYEAIKKDQKDRFDAAIDFRTKWFRGGEESARKRKLIEEAVTFARREGFELDMNVLHSRLDTQLNEELHRHLDVIVNYDPTHEFDKIDAEIADMHDDILRPALCEWILN